MDGRCGSASQNRPATEKSPSCGVTTRLGVSPGRTGGEGSSGPCASQTSSRIAAPSIKAPPAMRPVTGAPQGGPASGSQRTMQIEVGERRRPWPVPRRAGATQGFRARAPFGRSPGGRSARPTGSRPRRRTGAPPALIPRRSPLGRGPRRPRPQPARRTTQGRVVETRARQAAARRPEMRQPRRARAARSNTEQTRCRTDSRAIWADSVRSSTDAEQNRPRRGAHSPGSSSRGTLVPSPTVRRWLGSRWIGLYAARSRPP